MSEVCLDEAVNRKKAVNEASFHDLDSLRNVAAEAIDSCAAELGNVSNDIWSHPELSYQVVHIDLTCMFM